MAKISFPGLKAYEDKIAKLGKNQKDIIKRAVYDGAKVIADSVAANVAALPAVTDAAALKAYRSREPSAISVTQKQGLIESLGLSTMRDDSGYINTKLGFDGYNAVKTRKYPGGQPNALIARAAESGSVALIKTPFIRPGIKAAKKAAEKAMEKTLDKEIEKIMK